MLCWERPATGNAGGLSWRSTLQVYKEKKQHTQPPVSLLGQLLWREFYYAAAAHTPNYHQKEGNPICKQIDWDDNAEFFKVRQSASLPQTAHTSCTEQRLSA